MKNVVKCDTWCELQNPVNLRVFDRKLRLRPPGRGHAYLGFTQMSRSDARACGRTRRLAPRYAVGRKPAPALPRCGTGRDERWTGDAPSSRGRRAPSARGKGTLRATDG
ncbi:hypothetical protein IHE45_05G072600 [Dioscorea alata]|uniref:Uncharacterized protein n=1 Tax=Dioscorea alata TaxID=55571 RepID=A0ACB7W1Y4_DIOAL|nr:hypothetical protein IHE45_05G072600 [Dioscorea alata]